MASPPIDRTGTNEKELQLIPCKQQCSHTNPEMPPQGEQAQRHFSEGTSVTNGILGDTQRLMLTSPHHEQTSFSLHQH